MMTCDHPRWVCLARKEPQCATLRGRVFEIGAPDEGGGAYLLTVWEKGQPVGHILHTDPPSYRPCGGGAPQQVDGMEDLLELLVPRLS